MYFIDREQAGKLLIEPLKAYKNRKDAAVFGLLRGGIPLAFALSEGLGVPLQVLSVKKIGAPFQEELALGAVCQDGSYYLNQELTSYFSFSEDKIKEEIKRYKALAEEKYKRFSPYQVPFSLKGKVAILVDDGLATGATMLASIQCAKNQGASRIVVAVPVASRDALEQAEAEADEVVCLKVPDEFHAVGEFYRDFSQVEDDRVLDYLIR